jgi:NADH-quinone oxidoreductase subunit L
LHAPHGSTELFLVGGAIAIAVIGLGLGLLHTRRRPVLTPALAPAETGIGRVLAGKYFVDELYSRVIVRPTVWLSTTVLWKGLDQFFIDRVGVGGTARVAQGLGWLGSRLQNGQVALYVTLFTLGAVLVLRAVIGGGAP